MSSLEIVRQRVAGHRYAQHISSLSSASLAAERHIPASEPFALALKKAGMPGALVRGRVYQCTGVAPVSTAVALLHSASAAGSWVGWCATTQLNWNAARHRKWALERVVKVNCAEQWGATLGALADGIEVIVVDTPSRVAPAEVRRFFSTAVNKRCVVVVLGMSSLVAADVVFNVVHRTWSGASTGNEHGHLGSQSLEVRIDGRRVPHPHSFSLTTLL